MNKPSLDSLVRQLDLIANRYNKTGQEDLKKKWEDYVKNVAKKVNSSNNKAKIKQK